MISYPLYKIIHLTSIVILLTGLSIAFHGTNLRHIKMLTGIGTLMTLVGGMGLLARLGIGHGELWPLWVQIKLAIWFIVGIGGAIIARRFPKYGKVSYFVILILFIVAATAANYKWE